MISTIGLRKGMLVGVEGAIVRDVDRAEAAGESVLEVADEKVCLRG